MVCAGYNQPMNRDVTDAMINAEMARQEANRRAGIAEIEGRVSTDVTFWRIVGAILVANLITAVICGIVAIIVIASVT